MTTDAFTVTRLFTHSVGEILERISAIAPVLIETCETHGVAAVELAPRRISAVFQEIFAMVALVSEPHPMIEKSVEALA